MNETVDIDYYTDVLCVWAYFSQRRVDALKAEFGDRVRIRYRFVSLFGNNEVRIAQGWEKGGYAGYSQHVRDLAQNFPQVEVHPEIWTTNIPASSMPVHLVLKAVSLLEAGGRLDTQPGENGRTVFEELTWQLRQAFFARAENIADREVLDQYLAALEIPRGEVNAEMDSGRAFAALSLDFDEQKNRMIEGSPTFLLNEGRQRLYGNVGYRAIAANVEELLERKLDLPPWC